MSTAFNAADRSHKSVTGAVAAGETLRLRIVLPRSFGVYGCTLALERDGAGVDFIPMEWESTDGRDEWWQITLSPSAGLYFYHFEFETSWGATVLKKHAGANTAGVDGTEEWQLTVYPPENRTPESLRGGIIYQIFPDRFYNAGAPKKNVPGDRRFHASAAELPDYLPDDSGEYRNNDYFGGDLRGIAEKLPYLASLGVTILYLNPIAEAHSNHRYNTADYLKTDPLLGTDDDFRDLCTAAHALGMRVILDGVFSHTGDDSRYFNKRGRYPDIGAYQSPESPYRSWYSFGKTKNDYACWWGFRTLPEVNENDPSFAAFITGEGGVIDHWMDLGADGYRLDVADELPDAFIERVRAAVKRHGDEKLLLGEVWEDASSKWSHGGRRHYFDGKELDGVMNYPFRAAILDFCLTANAPGFMDAVYSIVLNYPPQNLHVCMNLLGSHDTARLFTLLAGADCDSLTREAQAQLRYTEKALQRANRLSRMAAAINYCLPGIPAIYYGDEIGMKGGKDPLNRACFPWGAEENNSLLEHYRALGRLRGEFHVLKNGGFYPLSAALGCAAFLRYQPGMHRVAVIANKNPDEIHYELNPDMRNMAPRIGGGRRTETGVFVPAETAVILTDE